MLPVSNCCGEPEHAVVNYGLEHVPVQELPKAAIFWDAERSGCCAWEAQRSQPSAAPTQG